MVQRPRCVLDVSAMGCAMLTLAVLVPVNFREANAALLGAWQGVINHAVMWAEVEDFLR